MIPLVFHFGFYRGANKRRWRDVYTLCLKSCQMYAGMGTAPRIIVHYDAEDTGADWEAARSLGGVEWHQTDFAVTTPVAQMMTDALRYDLYRLQTLWIEGGFYCNLDFVFLKSFDKFRDASAVIGTQCKQKQKLVPWILGGEPGSPYIRAYLDSYATPAARLVNTPWELSHRHSVMVLNRPVFYPVASSNKSFWSGGKACLKNAHALCLWEGTKPTLTLQHLRQTILEQHVMSVMDDQPTGIVQLLQGTMLIFE